MYKPILELKNISFVSKRKFTKEILKNISLTIFQSEIFGLTGESGSGKTTLARIICGLELQSAGKKILEGEEFVGIHKNHKIQMLFQNYAASHDPMQKINKAFNEILKLKNSREEEFFKLKKEILNLIGLSDDVLNKYPNQLSGGQLQRIALAKLLLMKPPLLILDEPFASQDVVSVANLIDILKAINQKMKITILCISHEISYLLKFCDRIGVMNEGKLIDTISIDKQNDKVVIKNCSNEYTRFLLKSFDIDVT